MARKPWRALALSNELGAEFPVRYDAPAADIEAAITAAIVDANEQLPVGTVYEIRAMNRPTGEVGDFGRRKRGESDADRLERRTANWGVAWYWTSADARGVYGGMTQEPLFRKPIADAEENKLGGYLIVARLKVPNG